MQVPPNVINIVLEYMVPKIQKTARIIVIIVSTSPLKQNAKSSRFMGMWMLLDSATRRPDADCSLLINIAVQSPWHRSLKLASLSRIGKTDPLYEEEDNRTRGDVDT
jgi:hypothetical protein